MQLKRSPKKYDAYARIYDDFKGDRSDNVRLLKSLIKKYQPGAHTLLDLACGTGSIAQGLAESFEIVGIDSSPQMLRIAKQKLPSMKLVKANMTNYRLEQKFDVVYCLHNSINHLTTFSSLEDTFRRVTRSLNKGGVFIFDVNPIEKMNGLVERGSGITEVGKNYVITQVSQNGLSPGLYSWDVKIFLKRHGSKFLLQHEHITVAAYPLDQIKQALVKSFSIADLSILEHAEKAEDIGRAYYVCVKK